jgi:tetratricopeptide (TPR) repeat protein
MLDEITIEKKYLEATTYYNSGCLKVAKNLIHELILNAPFRFEYWFTLGAIYQLEKNYNDAILSYKRALVLNKDDANIYFHIAECLLSNNEIKNAVSFLTIAKKKCLNEILQDKILVLLNQHNS